MADKPPAAIGYVRVSGQIPYGSRLKPDGVTLVDEPTEQRTLATIQRLRAAGGTTRDIEKELQRQGVRPRTGWHWHPKVLLDLCRRKTGEVAAS